ncbi:MAG: hypothetical protein MUE69_02015, partial [Myxococcota bacterium]|nr:hypothetical protein [Myxococcota bacterium]
MQDRVPVPHEAGLSDVALGFDTLGDAAREGVVGEAYAEVGLDAGGARRLDDVGPSFHLRQEAVAVPAV